MRINLRFAILLIVIFALITTLSVGWWHYSRRHSVKWLVQQGDEQVETARQLIADNKIDEAQEYLEKAVGSYGRALRKDITQVDVLDKYHAMCIQQQAEDISKSLFWMRQIQHISRQKAIWDTQNDSHHAYCQRLLEWTFRYPQLFTLTDLSVFNRDWLAKEPDNITAQTMYCLAESLMYAKGYPVEENATDTRQQRATQAAERMSEEAKSTPWGKLSLLWLEASNSKRLTPEETSRIIAKQQTLQTQIPDNTDPLIWALCTSEILTSQQLASSQSATHYLTQLVQSIDTASPSWAITFCVNTVQSMHEQNASSVPTDLRQKLAQITKEVYAQNPTSPEATAAHVTMLRITNNANEAIQHIAAFTKWPQAGAPDVIYEARNAEYDMTTEFIRSQFILLPNIQDNKKRQNILQSIEDRLNQISTNTYKSRLTPLLLRAELLGHQGYPQQAADAFECLFRNEPFTRKPDLLRKAAQWHVACGNLGLAQQYYQTVIQHSPNIHDYNMLGVILSNQGASIEKIEALATALLTHAPQFSYGYLLRAQCHAYRGKWPNAWADLQHVPIHQNRTAISLYFTCARKLGRENDIPEFALKLIQKSPTASMAQTLYSQMSPQEREQLTALLPKDLPAKVYTSFAPPATTKAKAPKQLATEALAKRDIAAFHAICAEHPEDHTLWELRIKTALIQRKWDEINSLLKKASLKNIPLPFGNTNVAEAMISAMQALESNQEITQAKKSLRQALEQHAPSYARGWSLLGTIALRDNDNILALQSFNHCQQLQPHNAHYASQLMDAQIRVGTLDNMLKKLEHIAQQFETNPGIQQLLIAQLGAHGDFDKSLDQLTKYQTLQPRYRPTDTLRQLRLNALLNNPQGFAEVITNLPTELSPAELIDLHAITYNHRELLGDKYNTLAQDLTTRYHASNNALSDLLFQLQILSVTGQHEKALATLSANELLHDNIHQNTLQPLLWKLTAQSNGIDTAAKLACSASGDLIIPALSFLSQHQLYQNAKQLLEDSSENLSANQDILFYWKTRNALNLNKHKQAEELCKEWLSQSPQSGQANAFYALILSTEPLRISETQQYLNKALELDPWSPLARTVEAKLYAQEGKHHIAIARLLELIRNNNSSFFTQSLLLNLIRQQRDAHTLASLATHSLRSNESNANAQALFAEALEWMAEDNHKQGELNIANHLYRQAARSLEIADKTSNKDSYLPQRVILLLKAQEDPSELANKLTEDTALSIQAKFNWLTSQQHISAAEQLLQQALSNKHFSLQDKIGFLQNSFSLLGPIGISRICEETTNPQSILAFSISYQNINDYRKSLSLLTSINPDDLEDNNLVAYHKALGQIYYQRNQIENARQHWQHAISLNDNDASSVNNLIYLLASYPRDVNDINTALEMSQKLGRQTTLLAGRGLMSQKNIAAILDTHGMVQMAAKKPEQALKTFRRCIEINPTAFYYLHQGQCFDLIGKTEDASLSYHKAKEMAEASNDHTTLIATQYHLHPTDPYFAVEYLRFLAPTKSQQAYSHCEKTLELLHTSPQWSGLQIAQLYATLTHLHSNKANDLLQQHFRESYDDTSCDLMRAHLAIISGNTDQAATLFNTAMQQACAQHPPLKEHWETWPLPPVIQRTQIYQNALTTYPMRSSALGFYEQIAEQFDDNDLVCKWLRACLMQYQNSTTTPTSLKDQDDWLSVRLLATNLLRAKHYQKTLELLHNSNTPWALKAKALALWETNRYSQAIETLSDPSLLPAKAELAALHAIQENDLTKAKQWLNQIQPSTVACSLLEADIFIRQKQSDAALSTLSQALLRHPADPHLLDLWLTHAQQGKRAIFENAIGNQLEYSVAKAIATKHQLPLSDILKHSEQDSPEPQTP